MSQSKLNALRDGLLFFMGVSMKVKKSDASKADLRKRIQLAERALKNAAL